MKAIISPAMNMREFKMAGVPVTKPLFPEKTELLAEELRSRDAWQLEGLLNLKPERAMRAYAEYQNFTVHSRGTPAALAFDGSFTYWNLGAEDFTAEDFAFAKKHLRILSAMYGILRPTDGIMPYRLEMGGKFSLNGESLYDFWGEEIHRELFGSRDVVINLASAEYSKAVSRYMGKSDRMITCDFMRYSGGKLKRPTVYIKMARGQMARYIVKNRVTEPEELKGFSWDGYRFVEEISTTDKLVFIAG